MIKMEIKNRKANYLYYILETFECGIELKGTEIKSIRKGSCDIRDSFAIIKNNEVFVLNMYIAKYKEGNLFNHDERRTRKLLLHKNEIKKLREKKEREGITLVPLEIYFKGSHAKLKLGVCKGKKLYDKRETIKKRDLEREGRNL
ncbi:MAG: SsrA-binding protein SmpB [Bacilli bacterium]|nr:SsrA-binding protein SmpB [Bacilli bacterium]